MSEPRQIGDIMLQIASNPEDNFGKLLRHCPFIQKELTARGLMSFDDLSGNSFFDNLIDGQDVMMRLHISQRTLQTLRSNGTIPFIKIGHKIWYHREDLERILRDNYTMFKIEERYGKDH